MFEDHWAEDTLECINPNFYQGMLPLSEKQENILNIAKAVNDIDPDNFSYCPFDLSFSQKDLSTIKNLKTKKYDYYGRGGNLSSLEKSIVDFIDSFIQDDNYELSKNIINRIDYILKAIGYEYMNIKITVGDSDLNYHLDKSFDEVIGNQDNDIYSYHSHSFVFTLKGQPTKFLPTNNEIRKNFYAIAKEYEFTYEVDSIESIGDLSSIKETRSAIFMRSSKCGSIHSAPEGQDRIVFVISPLLKTTSDLLDIYFENQCLQYKDKELL